MADPVQAEAVATHLYESWDHLRIAADRLLRIPLETPETLRHLVEDGAR